MLVWQSLVLAATPPDRDPFPWEVQEDDVTEFNGHYDYITHSSQSHFPDFYTHNSLEYGVVTLQLQLGKAWGLE